MKTIVSYFRGSFIFTAIVLFAVAVYGYQQGGINHVVPLLITTLILAILETSLSFDNAVINASILRVMSPFWRKLFITLGVLVAVFGMRILFPIAIISIASHVSLFDAFTIATKDPTRYQAIMSSTHLSLMGFGATFLLMVVLDFFLCAEKKKHWIPGLEPILSKLGQVGNIQSILALITVASISAQLHDQEIVTFIHSCFWGYIVYMALHLFKQLFGGVNIHIAAAKYGLIGFLYLEVLDASFSLDGVLAAFAITNQFWIIVAGLSIGGIFVRSMTILLTDRNIIDQFPHVENAAFWAIGTLVSIMLLSALHIELGELFTGLISLLIIGLGFVTSVWRKHHY